NLPTTEDQVEPRLGVVYYIQPSGTVLRATYNRVFVTPEYENILFGSSAEAASLVPPAVQESRPLGGGVLLNRSERQNAFTGGLCLGQAAGDAVTGGPVLIDADQKLQAQRPLLWDIGTSGLWLGAGVRYDSGLVTGVAPADLLADPDNAFAAPYIVEHSGTDL